MNVGVVGLGLIGGSMARAYKQEGHTVLAYDTNENTLGYALLAGIIDNRLGKDDLKKIELLFIALYPEACEEYLKENAELFSKSCVVIDLCGTKRRICKTGFGLAEKYGFTFIGGHPMAGTQFSGIKYSRSNLFEGAPMVIVPPKYDDILLLEKIKKLLKPAGFGEISVTTAEEHDKMIAFTSQLAHVVSNAYVKSETAQSHGGFSAGSYKDMTRVAWLNEKMWAELFMDNKDYLIHELDLIITSLNEYKTAMDNDDKDGLQKLLKEGRIAKEQVDGK